MSTPRARHLNALAAAATMSRNRNANKQRGNAALLARYQASLQRHRPPPATPKTLPKNSKWRQVRKALMIEGMKKYVKAAQGMKNYPFLSKLLKQRMNTQPIKINVPLYSGVYRGARVRNKWPNKGQFNYPYFRSFTKKILTAKEFAYNNGPGGVIYVIPPGTYPAININNYVKRRFPLIPPNKSKGIFGIPFLETEKQAVNKAHPNLPKNLKNFLAKAHYEGEVLFAPGTWNVGNNRPNLKAQFKVHPNINFKNIRFVKSRR